MNKAEIIKIVGKATGLKQAEVSEVFKVYADLINDAFEEGLDRVSFPDVGVFELKQSKARAGRNPQTGEALEIPAKEFFRFRFMPSVKSNLTREV